MCAEISDTGLLRLLDGCQHLSTLGLEGCERLTDLSVERMASCPQLRALNLARCRLLTDAGVRALLPLCRRHVLVELNVSQCAVTRESVRMFTAAGCAIVSSVAAHAGVE